MQSGLFSRRSFVTLPLAAACGRATGDTQTATGPGARKRLHTDPPNADLAARPRKPFLPAPHRLTRLGLTPGSRDALLYVPDGH